MKRICVETRRLCIRPRTAAEMELLCAAEPDVELKKAYGEMLDAMRALPGREEWGADWIICLRDGTAVGGAGFKGAPDGGSVEIGYGIDESHRNQGYAAEAVGGLCRWAFAQPGVRLVEAETAPDNAASRRVLAKNGFQLTGETGDEGPRFSLVKKD